MYIDRIRSLSGEAKQMEVLTHNAHFKKTEINEDFGQVSNYCSKDDYDVTNSQKRTLDYGKQSISVLINNLTSKARSLVHDNKYEEAMLWLVIFWLGVNWILMCSQNSIKFIVK